MAVSLLLPNVKFEFVDPNCGAGTVPLEGWVPNWNTGVVVDCGAWNPENVALVVDVVAEPNAKVVGAALTGSVFTEVPPNTNPPDDAGTDVPSLKTDVTEVVVVVGTPKFSGVVDDIGLGFSSLELLKVNPPDLGACEDVPKVNKLLLGVVVVALEEKNEKPEGMLD